MLTHVDADVEMGPHGRWLQVAPQGSGASLALLPGDERGVVFPEGIQDMPWARAAPFVDPDGNVLVLQTG